jgi:exopolysaccharide biosynthesis polyprenyl glycosylphosphotransferase
MAGDARAENLEPVHSDGRSVRPKSLYRLLAIGGTAAVTTVAVFVATAAPVQQFSLEFGSGISGSRQATATGGAFGTSVAWTLAVVSLATYRLSNPEPRRILDTITATFRSVSLAAVVLAALGFFGLFGELTRLELLLTVAVLAVALPAWFVAIQQLQLKRSERTLVVGTNPRRIEAAVQAAAEPIAGYALSPTDAVSATTDGRVGTDGGRRPIPSKLSQYECLGGLSRLDDILQTSNVGTVIPALPQTDRAEFFGVLETCYEHDVNVEILSEHNESVLVEDEAAVVGTGNQQLVGINLEPWPFHRRLCKRLFDVGFAAVGLLCTLPLLALIAVGIKLDSPGPVLYSQERTTLFGDTFTVYKFRSMLPESESAAPGEPAARITRVGRFLRRTHLDELPQLWAILLGQMSVVGPRAAWTAEEQLLEAELQTWTKRWFVKPGLTGLAQINELSSENSRAKLQYDLTYIRNQSFWFDLKIVVRQLWMVGTDLAGAAAQSLRDRFARTRL